MGERRGLGKVVLYSDSFSASIAWGGGGGSRPRPDIFGEILMMVFELEGRDVMCGFYGYQHSWF